MSSTAVHIVGGKHEHAGCEDLQVFQEHPMSKLSKAIATALLVTTAASVSLPAQAQPYPDRGRDDRYDGYGRGDHYERYDSRDRYEGYDRYDYRRNDSSIRAQIDELQRRVERTDIRDRISEREAASLRRDTWRLRQQFRDYSRNGLSRREAQVLQDQIQYIRQRLRFERRDDDGRRW
jgi:hypothetical protein